MPIPVHQWTHDGAEVLIVRQVGAGGASSHGFVWPLTEGAEVTCPDWEPTPECGHGLHGWPWGLAIGDGAEPDYAATWLVVGAQPQDVIDLGGKVKVRAGVVRHVGTWVTALAYTLDGRVAYVQQAASGSASATGERGSASATGGRGSASATGVSGSASATGWSGSASATGWRGSASATGEASAAVVTGLEGTAQAGAHGVIALAWWNERQKRAEMRCARVVDGKRGTLKPLTRYRLDGRGRFVEVA
jgi:hypothetical protein